MTRKHRQYTVAKGALLGVLASVLVACAPPARELPESDIQQALNRGDLYALYQEAQQQLKEQPGNSVLLENVRRIRKALDIQRKFEELEATITRLRTEEGVLPFVIMPSAGDEFAAETNVDTFLQKKLQELSLASAIYQKAQNLIRNEIDKRNDLLLEKTDQLYDVSAENLAERLALIEDIFILGGDAGSRQTNREATLEAASRQAFSWLQQDQYGKAADLFELLLREEPDLPDVKDGLGRANFQIRLATLEQHREQGDVEGVYQEFVRIASDPDSQQFVDQLRPSAEDLAGYFSLVAQGSMLTGEFLEAYQNLRKISDITQFVSLPDLDRSIEGEFISQIFVLAEEARGSGSLGLALGYLKVIEELGGSYSEVESTLNDIRSELYDEAVVKIAPFPFNSPVNAPGLGPLISASLTQHFVEKGYKDIRVLDRQSLSDVLKEQEIRSLVEDREVTLSASDYLVQGAVLEANVDTAKQDIRLTKRIVVDVKQVPNPRYDQWSRLTSQQRRQARLSEPPRFVTEQVKEDISSIRTRHSKNGGVIANYRIIDALNGELLYTDNLSSEAAFEDESIEGIEIGRFVQKAKVANLPADREILRDLAQALAENIALKIVSQLGKPELRYLKIANERKADDDLISAVQELGKAIAILRAKELPLEQQMTELKQLALQIQ